MNTQTNPQNPPAPTHTPICAIEEADALINIYKNIECLRTLSEQLDEENGGVAHMLYLIAEDLSCSCQTLDIQTPLCKSI